MEEALPSPISLFVVSATDGASFVLHCDSDAEVASQVAAATNCAPEHQILLLAQPAHAPSTPRTDEEGDGTANPDNHPSRSHSRNRSSDGHSDNAAADAGTEHTEDEPMRPRGRSASAVRASCEWKLFSFAAARAVLASAPHGVRVVDSTGSVFQEHGSLPLVAFFDATWCAPEFSPVVPALQPGPLTFSHHMGGSDPHAEHDAMTAHAVSAPLTASSRMGAASASSHLYLHQLRDARLQLYHLHNRCELIADAAIERLASLRIASAAQRRQSIALCAASEQNAEERRGTLAQAHAALAEGEAELAALRSARAGVSVVVTALATVPLPSALQPAVRVAHAAAATTATTLADVVAATDVLPPVLAAAERAETDAAATFEQRMRRDIAAVEEWREPSCARPAADSTRAAFDVDASVARINAAQLSSSANAVAQAYHQCCTLVDQAVQNRLDDWKAALRLVTTTLLPQATQHQLDLMDADEALQAEQLRVHAALQAQTDQVVAELRAIAACQVSMAALSSELATCSTAVHNLRVATSEVTHLKLLLPAGYALEDELARRAAFKRVYVDTVSRFAAWASTAWSEEMRARTAFQSRHGIHLPQVLMTPLSSMPPRVSLGMTASAAPLDALLSSQHHHARHLPFAPDGVRAALAAAFDADLAFSGDAAATLEAEPTAHDVGMHARPAAGSAFPLPSPHRGGSASPHRVPTAPQDSAHGAGSPTSATLQLPEPGRTYARVAASAPITAAATSASAHLQAEVERLRNEVDALQLELARAQATCSSVLTVARVPVTVAHRYMPALRRYRGSPDTSAVVAGAPPAHPADPVTDAAAAHAHHQEASVSVAHLSAAMCKLLAACPDATDAVDVSALAAQDAVAASRTAAGTSLSEAPPPSPASSALRALLGDEASWRCDMMALIRECEARVKASQSRLLVSAEVAEQRLAQLSRESVVIRNFQVGSTVLMLPVGKVDDAGCRVYLAFNVGQPHFYLDPACAPAFRSHGRWPDFIIGRVSSMQERTVPSSPVAAAGGGGGGAWSGERTERRAHSGGGGSGGSSTASLAMQAAAGLCTPASARQRGVGYIAPGGTLIVRAHSTGSPDVKPLQRAPLAPTQAPHTPTPEELRLTLPSTTPYSMSCDSTPGGGSGGGGLPSYRDDSVTPPRSSARIDGGGVTPNPFHLQSGTTYHLLRVVAASPSH